jgi:hypothetical protein
LTKNPKNSLFLYKKLPGFDPSDFLNKIQQTTQKNGACYTKYAAGNEFAVNLRACQKSEFTPE